MTSSATSDALMQPWLYFFSGALLPSLAYYFLWKRSEEQIEKLLSDETAYESDEDDDDDSDDDGGDTAAVKEPAGPPSSWGIAHAPYKMVLVVNQSLSMGKGKIAAQCSHAAVGCYKRARRACPAGLRAWERTGCAKIAVKCPNPDEFMDIAAKAVAKGIPVYLVEDAGRTQIAAGSRTVLGLGPAPVSVYEGVSDHLKLM